MPIMLQSNHALLFDGVSDGVIIPQGDFSKLGQEYNDTHKSSSDILLRLILILLLLEK
mgnify:CR=1 FL=1